MKTLFICIAMFTIIMAGFTSCKKDKENPTIVVSSPIEHTIFLPGANLQVTATFSDDRGLNSYHVHIGDAAGNHVDEFDWEESGMTSELSYSFSSQTIIPDTILGVYYIHFEAMDAEGKITEKSIEIHVEL